MESEQMQFACNMEKRDEKRNLNYTVFLPSYTGPIIGPYDA
jgi:hypothetical protein